MQKQQYSLTIKVKQKYNKRTKDQQGPTWSWSHGSWIYNYLCNQFLSPLKLRDILDKTLCDKVCQW